MPQRKVVTPKTDAVTFPLIHALTYSVDQQMWEEGAGFGRHTRYGVAEM